VSVRTAPNHNLAFAAALFEELIRSGVEHACLCPGSRSAPLAIAAVQQPALRCWSHVDERSAGFFALGLAKASRTPVALVCTSGTAAVNFHPAVVEAHHARVPLLVLTADRPPELRDWGAGQTIDQSHLYGGAARWFAEAPVPEPGEAPLRHARALASRAAATARARPPGPVHLNLPFREPLSPESVPLGVPPQLGPLALDGRDGAPYTAAEAVAPSPPPELVSRLADSLHGCERGVIACGPLDATPREAAAIAELASALGWPLLAEPTSQLRRGPHAPHAPIVASADLLLRDPGTARRLAPDCVLRFGDTPTSMALRLWLERERPGRLLLVDPDGVWHDPSHLASALLRLEPRALCEALVPCLGRGAAAPSTWLRDFLDADRRARRALETALDDDPALLAARAVRELGAALPDEALLYVSNSLAVRDLDAFLPAGPKSLRVLCNRGANGIDGMLSSALGAAASDTAPVVLLTGDLAFLHDAGALLVAHRHPLRASIVVLDDDGGGIFSFLPVAEHGEAVGFQQYFRAAHGLDLGGVARAYGAHFVSVSSWEHFRTALKDSFAASGVSVLRVPIDAERNRAQHRELERAVAAALAGDAA
jgi:2-succinyl-5-enolpyruvyl-6-hydroxy-3-cyclohexene-1-carboxylate synthase